MSRHLAALGVMPGASKYAEGGWERDVLGWVRIVVDAMPIDVDRKRGVRLGHTGEILGDKSKASRSDFFCDARRFSDLKSCARFRTKGSGGKSNGRI